MDLLSPALAKADHGIQTSAMLLGTLTVAVCSGLSCACIADGGMSRGREILMTR